MSQLAVSANPAGDSSVRLVRDVSDPMKQPDRHFDDVQMQSMAFLSPGGATPTNDGAKDITITTALEVASMSPFSTESQNMASAGPMVQVDAPNVPVQSVEQTIRMTKSAGALKDVNPQPPRTSSLDQIHHNTEEWSKRTARSSNPHDTAASTSKSQNKLPEFRQSKRWAKFKEAAEAKASNQQAKDQIKPLTMRESSFEQQRAQPKTSLQSPRSIPRATAKALSETDSIIQAGGLCRSLSVPTWQVIKTARVARPTSMPTKWVARKLSIRRHRRSASRQSETQGGVDLAVSPRKAQSKRRLRTRKAVADLRRKAGFASSTSKLVDVEKVIDLDTVGTQHPGHGSNSPVPSLHDPEKAKRFSQECEALLSNADFDKDFLAADGKVSATLGPSFGTTINNELPRPTTSSGRPATAVHEEKSQPNNAPGSSVEVRPVPETLRGVTAPEPPVRTSSKGGPRLASIVHMTRPACIPILHGFRDGALIGLGEAGESSSTLRPNQLTNVETPTRKSSTLSRFAHKGPRPFASTDTLTRIEAQIQDGVHPAIVEKLKQKTAFIVGSHKRTATASSIPPERPLPALPSAEAEPVPDLASGQSVNVDRSKQALNGELAQFGFNAPTRKLHEIAAIRGLTIDPITTQTSAPQVSPSLPTPSSTYSQSSMGSHASIGLSVPFTRHDISRLRPDRTRGVKKRVQDHLARERRISEEDETAPVSLDPADRPLPPVPPTEHRGSVDPLDQFPSVPSSRPQSRASVGTRRAHSQSRSRSHARHSSKASSIRPKHPRQKLGTSEIKVLVDSNPLTARDSFRAGALSPSPSIADSSRGGSPVKPLRGLSNTSISLQEIRRESDQSKKTATKKPSMRSLRSQASSRASHAIAKPPRGRYGECVTDSEDEISPLHSPARTKAAGTKKLRRRWNSNDIQTMRRLHDDFEYYEETITKLVQELSLQREEIQKQREEIQKTVRVFAPISQANGSKGVKYSALEPGFVADKDRVERSSILSREFNSLEESIKAARKKLPREKQSGEISSGKLRPISHISSASATTNVTTGSRGTVSDERVSMEGSMTDPLEYDLPNSVSAPARLNSKERQEGKREIMRPGSRGSLTAMHAPPPVAKVIPKTTLAEDDGGERLRVWGGDRDGCQEGDGKENRLSVNHGFTDTEQMDRAIEAFQSFA